MEYVTKPVRLEYMPIGRLLELGRRVWNCRCVSLDMLRRPSQMAGSSHWLVLFHHWDPFVNISYVISRWKSNSGASYHHCSWLESIRTCELIPTSMQASGKVTCSASIFFFKASRTIGVISPSLAACLMRSRRA